MAVFQPEAHHNFLLLASRTPGLADRLRRNPAPAGGRGLEAGDPLPDEVVAFDARRPVFTDDRTPAEIYGDLLFLRHLAEEK